MQRDHIPSDQSMIWPDTGRPDPGRPPGREKAAVSAHICYTHASLFVFLQ